MKVQSKMSLCQYASREWGEMVAVTGINGKQDDLLEFFYGELAAFDSPPLSVLLLPFPFKNFYVKLKSQPLVQICYTAMPSGSK